MGYLVGLEVELVIGLVVGASVGLWVLVVGSSPKPLKPVPSYAPFLLR